MKPTFIPTAASSAALQSLTQVPFDSGAVVLQPQQVPQAQQALVALDFAAILALEGTYTRLLADQMVIQQIEAAGIATLQETATTVSSRFGSIKMTLLAIHGAFAVKSVQQIAERQARLDQQLTQLRG